MDWCDPIHNVRIRKVLKARTESEAKLMAEQIRIQSLQNGGLLPKRLVSIKLEQAIDSYLKDYSSLKSIKSQETDRLGLALLFNSKGSSYLSDLTFEDIGKLILHLRDIKSYKASSINRYLNTIKSFIAWCFKRSWIKRDFSKEIKHIKGPIRESRPLSKDEISAIFLKAGSSLKLQIELAYSTGMRAGEIASLRWNYIDFDRAKIRIGADGQFSTKSGKSKEVFISSDLRKSLIAYKLKQGGGNWLFPNKTNSGPIPSSVISKSWRKARLRAEIRDIKFHDLRATAAVRFAELGLGDAAIAKLLGHSTTQMARKYSNRITDGVLRDASNEVHKSFLSEVSSSEDCLILQS